MSGNHTRATPESEDQSPAGRGGASANAARASLPAARLQILSARLHQAQWILGISAVLLLSGFSLLGYRPITQKLQLLERQIDVKRHELTTNQTRAENLPAVAREVESLRFRLQRFDKKLPKQPEWGQFLRDIDRLSHRAALRRVTIRQESPRRGPAFSEMPVVMTFEGDFLSVFAFLKETEDMQRLTRINKVEMRSRDTSAGQVEVQMTMLIYYLEG